MDAMNEPQEPGEQHEQTGTSQPIDEWHGAPTERHLGQEQPAPMERPASQPYAPQQPYPPSQYEHGYGRDVVDPSLPLGREPRGERAGWADGRDGERRRISLWVPIVGGCLVAIAAVIALCAVVTGITFGLARNHATVNDTQTRMVSIHGHATITIHASAANVNVVPGTTDQVTVVLDKEVQALDRQQAQNALDAITLDVTQSGNDLAITVHEPSFSGLNFFSRRADLTITAPAATSLDANLAAGNLDVRGLTGTLAVDMPAGNLTLDDMTLTQPATVRMQAGNLQANHIVGALTATMRFGNVTLTQATLTQNSTMRVDAGNVSFDGSLRSGASLDVTDNAGNVTLTLPRQTDAHLNASANAGKITLEGWSDISQSSGGVGASATGDLSANPTGTLTLHVNAGNITLTAD